MRVIILAAGQAVQLDGYNKLLIKDPESAKTIAAMDRRTGWGSNLNKVRR